MSLVLDKNTNHIIHYGNMIPPLLKVALIKFVHSNMGQSRAVTIITTLRAYDNHIFLMSVLNVKNYADDQIHL